MTRRLPDPDRQIPCLVDALAVAARKYPGGIPALAARMGQAASTLYNKFDPAQPVNPTLHDFEEVLAYTRAAVILDAVCAPVGAVWFFAHELAGCSDTELLHTVSRLMERVSIMTSDLREAVKDRTVTKEELDQLERDLYELTRAGREVIERARQVQPETKADPQKVVPANFGKGGQP